MVDGARELVASQLEQRMIQHVGIDNDDTDNANDSLVKNLM